jgi:hypothetical protein
VLHRSVVIPPMVSRDLTERLISCLIIRLRQPLVGED